MSRALWRTRLLPLAGLAAASSVFAQGTPGVSVTSLQACAAIETPNARLACYDQLAGRTAPVAAVSAPASPPAAPPARAAAPATTSAASAPPVAVSAAPIVPPATPAPGTPPAAAAPSKQSFGLYAAEHPTVYTTTALTATVIALGVAPNGRPTITLDGGQLWELDNSDPLLSKGDSVTIKRATFGSFLLTTSTGRSHRVHRLQ
jgi:hypothetical protein